MSKMEKEILSLLSQLDRDALIRIAHAALNAAEREPYISPEYQSLVRQTAHDIDSGEINVIPVSQFKERLNQRISAAKDARKAS